MTEAPHAYFLGGTLVLDGLDRSASVPAAFRWLNARWRCPAVHYRAVYPWLKERGIRNTIPRWQSLSLELHDERELHAYQLEALEAWLAASPSIFPLAATGGGKAGLSGVGFLPKGAFPLTPTLSHRGERGANPKNLPLKGKAGPGGWGSVVLPTGAGKTFLALHAIARIAASTLVVAPTLDLLHQWYACLENAFRIPIGVWYGLEKQAEPITVTTYPSAWAHAEALGNQFKLIVFDEIHHLPAPSWHEVALMYAAPYRLGLTATYPEPGAGWGAGELDPVALLDELVGPVVYSKRIDELSGEQLAEYRTQRIRVSLTTEERVAYAAAYDTYAGYIREARLRESHGAGWWNEFTRRSARDAQARRAKVAELKLKEIVQQAQAKLDVLDQLLREHRDQHMLIFTAHNRFAYQVARRHLLPAITHQTAAAERKAILEGFRAGVYRAIVTSKVLNEGVDVPEAKVAVVLGGSASAREYVQRLGRVLRKRGNQQAILYEVIARDTLDEGIAQRRRPRQTL